jgi:hypothetical protein
MIWNSVKKYLRYGIYAFMVVFYILWMVGIIYATYKTGCDGGCVVNFILFAIATGVMIDKGIFGLWCFFIVVAAFACMASVFGFIDGEYKLAAIILISCVSFLSLSYFAMDQTEFRKRFEVADA